MDILRQTLFQSQRDSVGPSRPLDDVEPLRRPMARLERAAEGDPARRHPDRAARRQNPISTRAALGLAPIAHRRLRGRRDQRRRRRGRHHICAARTQKSCSEPGGDEAAALATARMLAEAPKDRSADMLFTAAQHDPALEIIRARRRSAPVAQWLEFVAEPTLSLPERALAAWHSSGVESPGERRVGPGDLDAVMRTYARLGVPGRLLEAVAIALRKTHEPIALFLPLLWLSAVGGETELAESPLAPSGLIDGVPLYALDKHTRVGRQAVGRFARENAEIARFLTEHAHGSREGALRMAVFYADGALTRPTLQWRQSAELTAVGVAADFHSVNVAAGVGSALIWLVSAHIADLNAIRRQVLSRALPLNR